MPERIDIDTQELEDLIAEGKTLAQCAEVMGLKPNTLYARAANDQEVREAVERGKFRARQAGVQPQAERAPSSATPRPAKVAAKKVEVKRAVKRAAKAPTKRRGARSATPQRVPPPRNLYAGGAVGASIFGVFARA